MYLHVDTDSNEPKKFLATSLMAEPGDQVARKVHEYAAEQLQEAGRTEEAGKLREKLAIGSNPETMKRPYNPAFDGDDRDAYYAGKG